MRLNAIFDNVKIYDVQSQLDVVQGQVFQLEVLDGTPDIFTNNDQILDLDGVSVTASELGTSLIRFMDSTSVVKDLTINVVASVGPIATTLGGSLGDPVQK
jgi:adenosine deaminase